MDEHLVSLLEELSLRSCSEDENYSREQRGYNYRSSSYTSSSNVSSPTYEQLTNNIAEEDIELKNAVTSLLHDLKPTTTSTNAHAQTTTSAQTQNGYDKSKLLVALLGNVDLVTCAVKKINQLVSIGKRMEQIYRSYYVDQNVPLDLEEMSQLITAFLDLYNSENYVREVNVSRVYHAYCKKLIELYQLRTGKVHTSDCSEAMIS